MNIAWVEIWEEQGYVIAIHTKPSLVEMHSIRLSSKQQNRPMCAVLLIWLVALAIPFYGTINSLFSALTSGMTGKYTVSQSYCSDSPNRDWLP